MYICIYMRYHLCLYLVLCIVYVGREWYLDLVWMREKMREDTDRYEIGEKCHPCYWTLDRVVNTH